MRLAKVSEEESKWHPKKKYVPSRTISTSVSSSQDDIEIAGSEVSKEGTSLVFCNKQLNCRNSS